MIDGFNLIDDYQESGTSFITWRYPNDTSCFYANGSVGGTLATHYTVKAGRYVLMNESQDIGFDIEGFYVDEDVIRGEFDKTPSYLKDYNEDDDYAPNEEKPC